MTMTGRPRPATLDVLPGPADYQRVEGSLGRDKAGFTIQRRWVGERGGDAWQGQAQSMYAMDGDTFPRCGLLRSLNACHVVSGHTRHGFLRFPPSSPT